MRWVSAFLRHPPIILTVLILLAVVVVLWIFSAQSFDAIAFLRKHGLAAAILGSCLFMLALIWLPKWQAARPKLTPQARFEVENNARKTLAEIVGGAALLVGLYFTWNSVEVSREGQITERFAKAIEHLGTVNDKREKQTVNDKREKQDEIRLGGIYALERIARDSQRDHWPIMEVLTAYLRTYRHRRPEETTRDTADALRPPKFAPDIEAVLTVLKRRTWQHEEKGLCANAWEIDPLRVNSADFENPCPRLWPSDPSQANPKKNGQCLNLRGTDLSQANLQDADLQRAQFAAAHLRRAYLSNAQLQRAEFYGAKLEDARLGRAGLAEACFWRADLRRVDFSGADLQEADFQEANLQGAIFSGAKLKKANFREALLQDAKLKEAKDLTSEQLLKAKTLYQADLKDSDRKTIEEERQDLLKHPIPVKAQLNLPPDVHVTIDSPSNHATVDHNIRICGEIRPWPLSGHLWWAVEREDRIWPKDPEVLPTGTGPSWAVTIHEEGVPPDGRFNLILYLVEAEGDARIRNWLHIGNATDTFPALREIPKSRVFARIEELHMQPNANNVVMSDECKH